MNSQGLRWLQLPAAFSYKYFIVLTVNKLPLYRYCDTFLDRVITTFIITHNLKQTNLYLLFISSWLNPEKTRECAINWLYNSFSPDGNLDSQISVDGDSQQGKDGALCDDQQQAGEEEAGVELSVKSQTNDDSQRDDQNPHSNVSHGQRHNEAESGVAESPVHTHNQHHQHIPQHRGQGNSCLNGDVHHVHMLPRLYTRRGRHFSDSQILLTFTQIVKEIKIACWIFLPPLLLSS